MENRKLKIVFFSVIAVMLIELLYLQNENVSERDI